jgi:hypothetical protein
MSSRCRPWIKRPALCAFVVFTNDDRKDIGDGASDGDGAPAGGVLIAISLGVDADCPKGDVWSATIDNDVTIAA